MAPPAMALSLRAGERAPRYHGCVVRHMLSASGRVVVGALLVLLEGVRLTGMACSFLRGVHPFGPFAIPDTPPSKTPTRGETPTRR